MGKTRRHRNEGKRNAFFRRLAEGTSRRAKSAAKRRGLTQIVQAERPAFEKSEVTQIVQAET